MYIFTILLIFTKMRALGLQRGLGLCLLNISLDRTLSTEYNMFKYCMQSINEILPHVISKLSLFHKN